MIVHLFIFYSDFLFSGPLLYHFADVPHEMSLELSWEDVKRIIIKTGFEILVSTDYYYIQPRTAQSQKQLYMYPFFVSYKENKNLTHGI